MGFICILYICIIMFLTPFAHAHLGAYEHEHDFSPLVDLLCFREGA